MKLWLLISTSIVAIQFVMGLPVDKKECDKKIELCGTSYENFVRELCSAPTYSNCPIHDDDTMPQFTHMWQVANECCETGCKAGYLKQFYCTDFFSTSTEGYQKEDESDMIQKILQYFGSPVYFPVQLPYFIYDKPKPAVSE